METRPGKNVATILGVDSTLATATVVVLKLGVELVPFTPFPIAKKALILLKQFGSLVSIAETTGLAKIERGIQRAAVAVTKRVVFIWKDMKTGSFRCEKYGRWIRRNDPRVQKIVD